MQYIFFSIAVFLAFTTGCSCSESNSGPATNTSLEGEVEEANDDTNAGIPENTYTSHGGDVDSEIQRVASLLENAANYEEEQAAFREIMDLDAEFHNGEARYGFNLYDAEGNRVNPEHRQLRSTIVRILIRWRGDVVVDHVLYKKGDLGTLLNF